MPKGLYLRKLSAPQRGDIVAVCLSKYWQRLGLKKGYLRFGSCEYHSSMLIKKIIALPGDHVQLTDNFISVNNIYYYFPSYYFDHLGRRLLVYPRNKYCKTKGYWLIGSYDTHSWDSRYWGPVNRQQIKENLKLLISWDHSLLV